MSALRVVYMGTPDFAVPTLQALIDGPHEVVGVVTQPDRPSGRGKQLTAPPVKDLALAHGIDVYQPETLRRNDEAFAHISTWRPDVCVVAAYGQILPQRFLDIPRLGCVNVHASVLPSYRGASPINAALIHGEAETGVTLMQMEKGLDTGPMLEVLRTPIEPLETAQELHDRLSQLGASAINDLLSRLSEGLVVPQPQDDAHASYASMMKKEDGKIDFSRSAEVVANLIRGVNPWPGAYADLRRADGRLERVKFHLARPVNAAGAPGQILETAGRLLIACGEGAIDVLSIQPQGGRAMEARDFLNGARLQDGDLFV